MARRPTLGVALPPAKEISLHMSAAAFMRRALPPEIIWYHCPNGEVRDKATAGKLKGMGVLAGVPDLCFVMPNGQAAFLELKVGGGRLDDDQITFGFRARSVGCGHAVATTMEEVEAVLARWMTAYGLKLRATITTRRAA